MNYKEEIIRYRFERAEETYQFPSPEFRVIIHNLGDCQVGLDIGISFFDKAF